MAGFNPEKKRKTWETSYPRNKPKETQFFVSLPIPANDEYIDVTAWEEQKEERRAWLHESGIKFVYYKSRQERKVVVDLEGAPSPATPISSGFSPGVITIVPGPARSGKSMFMSSWIYHSSLGIGRKVKVVRPKELYQRADEWIDIYSFYREEDAVAFKLLFG